MQNSSERLYCSFLWKTRGNHQSETYLSPNWMGSRNFKQSIGGYVRIIDRNSLFLIIIQLAIDFFLIKQLRTAHKVPILPCKRLARFWVLSAEDYEEPEDAFKKVIWDKVGFEDYFHSLWRLFSFSFSFQCF